MRVLVATDHSFARYGAGVYDTYCFGYDFFADYLKVFDSVEVVCRLAEADSLPQGAFRSDGAGVVFEGVAGVHGAPWLIFAGLIARRQLRAAVSRADAVIARVPSQLGWYAALEARRLGRPYMVEVIGEPNEAMAAAGRGPMYRAIGWHAAKRLKMLAQGAAAASYVSRDRLPHLYPLAAGRPSDSISSIRLDAKFIQAPRSYRGPLVPIRLVSVGTLTPRKRLEDLIRASQESIRRGACVEVHIAGSGPCRAPLEALCRAEGLEKTVKWHGQLAGQKQVFELLDKCELFVMTSASEGLPRVVLEAMARGVPVIGSRATGTVELVREKERFSIGDIDALSRLIVGLAQAPERMTEMSHYSIETAIQYTGDKLSPRRGALYRALRDSAQAAPIDGTSRHSLKTLS